MYLKSIEVQGFKSFANKLVFEFHNGITGIVGPNGSGKSNIADAVRWVLGEQSAKQLRGANMQDVIFSGTETRKPQSYAHVALTITNEDHKLNIPYEEVEVARRVYRSGESEYLLNGTTCRLKDVQELFFDTGIGKEGYSIIGQGQVDKILSGKPEERRELFDEAAGIVKFKKRKRKTERDLEIESQNLLRIRDILEELEKQVGPLEKQSEKAKEYLRLKEELRIGEINLFLADYDNYQKELSEIRENIKNASEELERERNSQAQLKKDYEDIERSLDEYNKNIESNKDQINEDRLMISKFENEISLLKQNIDAVIQGKEFSKERIETLAKSMEETKLEMEGYKNSVREAKETLSHMKAEKKAAEENLVSLTGAIAGLEEQLSQKNESIYVFMNETTEISTEQQKIESMIEQNAIKKIELSQRMLTIRTGVSSATEAMEVEKAILESISKKLSVKVSKKQELMAHFENLLRQQKEIEQAIQEKQRSFHMASSKLDSLKNLTERYEGYGQSIRRVMEQKEKRPGIVGVVADIFKVEKKYETAVETALGGSIQNIVTEDENTAKELISFLKKNRYGRATFLPLTTVSASANRIKPEILKENGVIGNVASLVKNDAKFSGLIEYLLGRFILVDTIDNAMALGRKYHHSLRMVTLEGDLLNPGGSMSGGAYRNSSNLLGRHREMDGLKEQISSLEKELDKGRKALSAMSESAKRVQEDIVKKETECRELQLEENTAAVKYEQAIKAKEEKELEYKTIANDGSEIEAQRIALQESVQKIQQRLEENKNKNLANKNTIEALTVGLEEKRNQQKSAQEEVAAKQLELSSFEQQNRYILENLDRARNTLNDLEEEHFSYVEDHSRSDEKVADMEHTIAMLEEKMEKTRTFIQEREGLVESDTLSRDTLMIQQREFFDKRDELVDHISGLDKETFRLQAKEEKLDEKLTDQIDYMWNEYEITYIGAKQFLLEDGISYTKRKSIVSDTKCSLRSLGDVNVNAIEDYKNVKERYETLKVQHDDLVESEAILRNIIEELDEEMRKQFSEKFAEIRVQFDKVFKELFGGGKGTLELIIDDEVDLLDAGISIVAQPPGKKLANMMQLSGGERALTAIALLFAIQNLKPSPFCLLDEIEAALDDSNVKRYAKYLHKLTKTTQFIVITHRQGTMASADALYGITMQEKGVSTRVSVNLIEEQIAKESIAIAKESIALEE